MRILQANCTELGTPKRAKLNDADEKRALILDQIELFEGLTSGDLTPEMIAYYDYCQYRIDGGYRQ